MVQPTHTDTVLIGLFVCSSLFLQSVNQWTSRIDIHTLSHAHSHTHTLTHSHSFIHTHTHAHACTQSRHPEHPSHSASTHRLLLLPSRPWQLQLQFYHSGQSQVTLPTTAVLTLCAEIDAVLRHGWVLFLPIIPSISRSSSPSSSSDGASARLGLPSSTLAMFLLGPPILSSLNCPNLPRPVPCPADHRWVPSCPHMPRISAE
jgi:hypothetical protein